MRVLFFGPLTPPYNGQSVAFTTVVQNFEPDRILIINTAKYGSSILNSFYATLKTLWFFFNYRFEVVYFTSSRSVFGFLKEVPLLLLARITNKRIINHLHGADFKDFYRNSGFLKLLIRECYKAVGTSIVLTESMKNEFIDFPEMKVETVSNFYPKELDQQEFLKRENLQILYLSNLMSSKGIFYFLDACKILLDKYPEITVKVAGSPVTDHEMTAGQIRKKFVKELKFLKHKFSDRVTYEGVVSGQRKSKLLFESSIFVLPTFYPTEAIPLTIIEAMRSGNVIVTTNHNYLSDLVNSKNGLLVKPKCTKSLVEGIDSLIKNSERIANMKIFNQNFARENFSESNYISNVNKIIQAQ